MLAAGVCVCVGGGDVSGWVCVRACVCVCVCTQVCKFYLLTYVAAQKYYFFVLTAILI